MLKDGKLVFPVSSEFRRPVEADFANIARAPQESVEKGELGLAFVS